MINPYSYFGWPDIWPRGFKINDLGKNINDELYVMQSFFLNVKPLIFQGLINGYPDVDSLISVYNANSNNKIDINFYSNFPLLYFPGHFVPINSKNTKFLYEIFPALILPTLTNDRVCDIIRGYIIQRFAWIYNGTVLFMDSPVYNQKITDGNWSSNFIKEKYFKYELDNLLSALTCKIKESKNPFEFLIQIVQILVIIHIFVFQKFLTNFQIWMVICLQWMIYL